MVLVSKKLENRVSHFRDIMLDLCGIDPLVKSRQRDVVTARNIVAYQLIREGYTLNTIAKVFKIKNHTTILNYKKRIDCFDLPGWESEKELWEKFKENI